MSRSPRAPADAQGAPSVRRRRTAPSAGDVPGTGTGQPIPPLGSLRRALCAALAAGALLPFAFAPYGLWALAPFLLALLLHLLASASRRVAAWMGWCFGLGMFGHGIWWIEVSVHQFGIPQRAFSITATALLAAAMALYPALFAWCLRAMPAHGLRTRLLVGAPALWLGTEALRGWLGTGFPWLSLGYSQIDGPLAGFAPVGGVAACSWAVMVCAATLALAVPASWRERTLLALLVVLVGGAGYGLRGHAWTAVSKSGLDVALVQGAIPQETKWDRALRDRSLAHYLDLTKPFWNADLVIWPETAIPAFPSEVPEMIELLQSTARAERTTLLVGMPTGEPWNGRYFNSVVAFGDRPAQYDKRHLVPFGEFFPFKQALNGFYSLLSIPLSDFSRGARGQPLIRAAGVLIGVSICYEDVFGAEVAQGLPAASVLVNVSNDAWFGDTIAPHQHLEIARMRALETGRNLLRATNTGISAVIDHHGRVRARAPQFEPTVLHARFVARSGSTPYVRWGDWPLRGLLALSLATVIGRERRRVAV